MHHRGTCEDVEAIDMLKTTMVEDSVVGMAVFLKINSTENDQ